MEGVYKADFANFTINQLIYDVNLSKRGTRILLPWGKVGEHEITEVGGCREKMHAL